ncbi:MAG: EamA family transporter [Candidatus Bipolaricaulia bacterium]
MNLNAILLVLASGLLHANWNYLAKSSKDKLSFLWGAKVVSVLVVTPIFIYYLTFSPTGFRVGNLSLLITLGAVSGLVHVFYFYFLSMAYRYGDISFSYPIARGTAPFLVALLSFFFLAESPSLAGLIGMVLIAIGIGLLVNSNSVETEADGSTVNDRNSILDKKKALTFALLTSIMISSYIFLDGKGSRVFTPIVFMYVYSVFSTLFFTTKIIKRSKMLFRELEENLKPMMATGIMEPLSYFLALKAMQLSQLGYVASLRNVSILFATLLGVIRLNEQLTPARATGSIIVFLGVVSLGFG